MTEVTSDYPKATPQERELIDKVKGIIATHLGCDADKITTTTNIVDDLGADSLDVVELVMVFEEEFNIEILDEEAEKIATFDDALSLIARKVGPTHG